MEIFLDTCDIEQVKFFKGLGLVDGVTTNPSIIAKSGRKLRQVIEDLCAVIDTSVSVEVIAVDYDAMLEEAKNLLTYGSQITIKLPLTVDGLRACKTLSDQGVRVNMTLCFSTAQMILAAKAGAAYASLFMGRLEDDAQDALGMIKEISHIYKNDTSIQTRLLVASIRTVSQVIEAAKSGADIITVPPLILESMIQHPMTDIGLEKFLYDLRNSGAV